MNLKEILTELAEIVGQALARKWLDDLSRSRKTSQNVDDRNDANGGHPQEKATQPAPVDLDLST
jgi:hypothetical protein